MTLIKEASRKNDTKTVELVVDNVPYQVKITPEKFNEDTRFFIEVNGDGGQMYAWYPDLLKLRALGEDGITLPAGLEEAISHMVVKTVYIK
ncbi:MAG: hypothetical protein EOO10_23310 [Chitinophagaceae bacterium]|nr:MAG: hypothetical protein EOO10_23310 [Chitinophagaceae bacterium]